MKKFILILGCNFKQLPYLINLKKKYSVILIDKKKCTRHKIFRLSISMQLFRY